MSNAREAIRFGFAFWLRRQFSSDSKSGTRTRSSSSLGFGNAASSSSTSSFKWGRILSLARSWRAFLR